MVDKAIVIIGRSESCDVVLASKKVSRQHCCLAKVDDRLVVRDLGSTNGLRINGRRRDQGQLAPGDVLTIGDARYRLDGDPNAIQIEEPSDEELENSDHPIALSDNRPASPWGSLPAQRPANPARPDEPHLNTNLKDDCIEPPSDEDVILTPGPR